MRQFIKRAICGFFAHHGPWFETDIKIFREGEMLDWRGTKMGPIISGYVSCLEMSCWCGERFYRTIDGHKIARIGK